MFSIRAVFGFVFLVTFALSAAPPEGAIRLSDHGQMREFVVARDEVAGGRTAKKIPMTRSAAGAREAAAAQAGGELVLYPATGPRNAATRRLLTKRLAVQLAPGTDAAAVAARAGAAVASGPRGEGWYILQVAGGPGAALEALPKLRGGGVLKVEPLLARQQQKRGGGSDPLSTDQWYLDAIKAPAAWSTATGAGVRIGIVDDGLQHSHPDLSANYDSADSYDFNGRDADPEPPAYFGDDHGTSCAGLAAARGFNGIGVRGVAYNARLAGLRLISFPTTDEDEANAFAFHDDTIHIKSNSWGPPSDGLGLEGPGIFAVTALEEAVRTGRGGRGTIFLFSSGNDARIGDNVNFDGYANRREVIAIGATTDAGVRAFYSERGASLTVCAPSDGGSLGVTTVDRAGDDGYNFETAGPDYNDLDYTNTFGGTSASCPIAAGVVALMLEENPVLGWRDVQEILLKSALKVDVQNTDWITNGGGFNFNHSYGAGQIDAAAAVALAATWTNLGPERKYEDRRAGIVTAIPDNRAAGIEFTFNVPTDRFRVEHVALTTSIRHARRGSLEITLTSPDGTISRLAELRLRDRSSSYEWTFTSVRHWGELAKGDWKVRIADRVRGNVGVVQSLGLTLWGASPQGALELTAINGVGGQPLASVPATGSAQANLVLTNRSAAPLTGLTFSAGGSATLGVVQTSSPLPTIAAGASGTFTATLTALGPVGTTARGSVVITADGGYSETVPFSLPIGVVEKKTFTATGPFALPTFTSRNGAGRAGKYGTAVEVSGLPTGSVVLDLKLHLAHFTHSKSYDVDALLVSPDKRTLLVMGDVGSFSADDVNLVLSDDAELPLTDTAKLFSGTYRPANYGITLDSFGAPAPRGRYGFSFSTFKGANPTGPWVLYLMDDAPGGVGSLASWSLELTYAHP